MIKASKAMLSTIFLIAVAVLTAVMFVILPERNATFYISYCFLLLGLAVVFVNALVLSSAKPANLPQDIAFLSLPYIYLVAVVIVSVGALVLEYVNGDTTELDSRIYLLIHFVLLAVFAVRYILLMMGKQHIDTVTEKTQQGVTSIRTLCADIDVIREKIKRAPMEDSGIEADLNKLYDAVRYSDPISNPMVHNTEEKIRAGIAGLFSLIDDAKTKEMGTSDLRNKIADILSMIKDRNNRIKLSK